jgi:hypothetical protein
VKRVLKVFTLGVSSLVLAGMCWPARAQLSAKEFVAREGPMMDQHLIELAGPYAVDCGRVHVLESPEKATRCALKSFHLNKAFHIRYDIQGIDSAVAGGLAAVSRREIYAIEFDSMGWASEGLPKNSKLSSDNHLVTTPCPRPIKLLKTGSGRLTCFPPDPKAKTNIMSPNIEPF